MVVQTPSLRGHRPASCAIKFRDHDLCETTQSLSRCAARCVPLPSPPCTQSTSRCQTLATRSTRSSSIRATQMNIGANVKLEF